MTVSRKTLLNLRNMEVQKPFIEMSITCIVKTVVNVSSQGTRSNLDNYRIDIE